MALLALVIALVLLGRWTRQSGELAGLVGEPVRPAEAAVPSSRVDALPEEDLSDPGPSVAVEPESTSAVPVAAAEAPFAAADRPEDPVPAVGPALVALVIDDLGRELESLRRLEQLSVPVTYAVLPFERKTPEVMQWLGDRELEILLHLPMQAEGNADPGPGALYTSLDQSDILQRTRRALAAVPGVVGVNNHMGSAFSADPVGMRVVLRELADRGLFFLDSRTSSRSVGFDLARQLGVPSARRSVFLDDDPAELAVDGQFDRLLDLARRDGSAIAIGHPYASTLSVLERRVSAARASGTQFVPVSYLLERSGLL